MQGGSLLGSVAALRRKLRALAAVAGDPAATEDERATARALKARLEHRLKEAGAPKGDWSDVAFRLGRWTTELSKSTAPAAPKGDWTDAVHRLGKGLRRSWRRWLSE